MSSVLAESEVRIVRLFVACVLGRFDVVRELRAACAPGEPDRRWREAVLQVHVFAGFPRLVESFDVLAECGGLGTFDANELGSAPDARARGDALFTRIYRKHADDVRARLERHHPDFCEWTLTHAYGRVLARDGLDARMRELLACGALAAFGQDRQLASHVRGAVRCGATLAQVHAVFDALHDLVAPERLAEARRIAERFAGT